VNIWELDYGRGMQTLRGLASQASHLCCSADGRWLSARAYAGQIAIWNLEKGSLHALLDGPTSGAENDASLAFDKDGTRLASSAGTNAKLWDVAAARELNSWQLPAGSKDALAFHPSGQLLLMRAEAEGQASNPTWVGRIRDLLGANPLRPVADIKEFSRHLLKISTAFDGRLFLAEGIDQGVDGQRRAIKAFDSATGAERWSISSTRTPLVADLCLDPSGTLAAVRTDNRDALTSLIDVSTGKSVDTLERIPICISPNVEYMVSGGGKDTPDLERGYGLFRRGASTPLIVLSFESTPTHCATFAARGGLLAWPNSNGTVSVCNLEQLRKRLLMVDLAW